MSLDTGIVFAVLGITIALFTTDWLRLDVVAMLSVLSLMLVGVLDVKEGLAGFADPLVLIIAGLFVVGTGLFRTGVAEVLGLWLGRIGGKEPARLIAAIMVVVALLSAFMSSTGTVAVTRCWCRESGSGFGRCGDSSETSWWWASRRCRRTRAACRARRSLRSASCC